MPTLDALGTLHHPAPEARIVSLVPSIIGFMCELTLAGRQTQLKRHPQRKKRHPRGGGDP